MAERTLAVRVSADIAQFQQAMSQAQSSLHSFQQALGASGSAVHGFQSAASGAASAAHQVGSAQHQAASQVNQANSQIVSSNTNSANSFGQFARRAVAIVGVGAVFKSTIKAGMDFQSSLNTLGAVSSASAAKMQQVADTARQLGADISIPGASAATAAAAMTELAKGGLSVDQAMQAAKGTLQLAAAAQIDGAQAAEIQARAINTFGLAGKDASHVGDVLANTANAATGDITDFAAALAQGGLVAHSMGISIDDTSTALGLFANQGLIGSDAGTSLKTMLVQLQSPTKKQADALAQLGVKAFDASGNFVGMRTVTEELSGAQATLTQQQFDAAASTAFGTDGVRAAIAMAAGGTAAYDKMSAAVGKVGGAATLAGAQTKGLKGAFLLVQNAAQDAQLALMDKLSPALEAGTKQLAGMIPSITNALVPALGTAGTAVLGIAQQALPLLSDAATAIAPLFTAAASGIGAIMPMLKGVVGIIGGAAKIFAGMPGPVHAAVLALLAMRLVRGPLSSVGSAAGTVGTQIKLMGQQFATLRLAGMGSAVATAAVGLRSMGTAAKGLGRSLSGAFGGPIGLAIVAITTALSIFSNRNKEAKQRIEDHKAAIQSLAETMDKATGKITEATKAAIRTDFGNVAPAFDAVKLNAGEAANAIIAMETDGGAAAQRFREKIVKTLNFDDIGKRLSSGGMGSGVEFVNKFAKASGLAQTEILRLVAVGGQGLEDLRTKLIATGMAPDKVAAGINRLRGDVENTSGVYSAFTGQQDQMNKSMGLSAAQVETTRKSWAGLAHVDFSQLNGAMNSAVVSGKDLESVFSAFGITGPQFDAVLKAMEGSAVKGADGMHYMSQAAADAAGAAADAAPKVEGLTAAQKKTDDAARAAAASADVWKKAVADAKPPTDGLKAALDETKAAADGVTTAADFMAAAILRASGHDVDAATAQREQAAAMRGVTEGIYEKIRAGQDDKKATGDRVQAEKELQALTGSGLTSGMTPARANAISGAQDRIASATQARAAAERTLQGLQDAGLKKGETQARWDAAIATAKDRVVSAGRRQAAAERDLQTLQQTALKKGETQAQRDTAIADAKQKVAAAIRAEQDAHLKNAAAQTADVQGYEKAAATAAQATSQVTNVALATGDYTAAVAAGQAEMAKQRKAFIDSIVAARASGESMDAARKRAEGLANTYGMTPKAVATAFTAETAAAKRNGDLLVRTYDATNKTWTAEFTSVGDARTRAAAGETLQAYDQLRNTWTANITAKNQGALEKIAATTKAFAGMPDKTVSIGADTKNLYADLTAANKAKLNAKLSKFLADTNPYFTGLSAANKAKLLAKIGPLLGNTAPFLAKLSEANRAKLLSKLAPLLVNVSPYFAGLVSANRAKLLSKVAPLTSDSNPYFRGLSAANRAELKAKLAKLTGDAAPYFTALSEANRAKFLDKLSKIMGDNTDAKTKIKATQDAIDALTGKTVAITYTGAVVGPARAGGGASAMGAVQRAARGRLLRGPGTGTSDSIPVDASNGEYIVNAKATAKHLPLIEAINRDVPAFATGGLVSNINMLGSSANGPNFSKMFDTAAAKMAPAMAAKLQAMAAAMALAGGGFSVGSGNWGPPNLRGLAANTLAAEKFVQSRFGINNIGGWAPSGSVAASDHPKGKAIDVMIANWRAAGSIAKGNEVAAYFTGHPNDFGTKYVIWRNQIDTGSGWRPYTRSDRGNISDPTLAHMDHVHVSFLSGPSGPMQGAGGGGGGAAVPAGSAESRWYPLMHRVIAAKGFNQSVFPIMAKQMHMESSGNPRSINLWDSNARAGHPSKGLLQFIDCVPLATTILTRRGWMRHDEVQIGDETIGLNPESGRSEWTRVTGVIHHDDAEVWRIGGSRWSADVTPRHRWAVERRTLTRPETLTVCPECGFDGRFGTGSATPRGVSTHRGKAHGIKGKRRGGETELSIRRRMATTEDLLAEGSSNDSIVIAAPADTSGIPALSVEDCAVLGWLHGDGHVQPALNTWGEQTGWDGTIYQAKPPMVVKLRSLLAHIPHTEDVRPDRPRQTWPAHVFRLRRAYVTELMKRSEVTETSIEEWVSRLSPDQRAGWLGAMIDAEGNIFDGYTRISQVDGPMQDAIRLAVYLEGWRPAYSALAGEKNGYQPSGHVGMATPRLSVSMMEDPEVLERQPVWCVTTELGTWTMRQGRRVTLTGNSTFAQYADPGYNTNIWDPESQFRAFLNYVPARYSRGFQHLTDIGNRAYARGGMLHGPGTGTSDSLNIRASKGEFLTNARATSKHLSLLKAINADVPAFAAGGQVGALAGLSPRQPGSREGLTLGGLDELSAAIRGLRDAANAAGEQYRTAAKDLSDARAEAARTAAAGRADVAGARADLRAVQADQGRNVAQAQLNAGRSVADALEKRRATLLQDRAELNSSTDRHKAYAAYVADDRATMLDLQRAQQDAALSTRDAILQQRKEIAAAADKLRAAQLNANADNQVAGARVAAANRVRQTELQLAKATDARADRAEALHRSESRLVWTQARLGQKFDQLTGQLGDARDKLSGLRGDRASQAASLGSSIGNYDSGILGQPDTRRSPADIIRGMTFDLSKVSQFTNSLNVLKGKGLSGGLLEQIASAGVDGGGTTASALTRASKADIARINALQKSTEKWANVGGGLVAGANFDPLIASQSTLVSKLSTYTAQVDGAMRAIANALNAMDVKLVMDPQGMARLVNRGNVLLGRR